MAVNTTNLIGQVVNVGVGTLFKIDNANKQRELEERIAKMSLETQRKIQFQLSKAKTNIEKQRIAFQILALNQNESLVRDLEKDRNETIKYLAIGMGILATVIIILKNKKNG